MGRQSTEIKKKLYRFVDIMQPEVKWAIGISIIMTVLFVALSLYSNFSIYEDDICNLLQCIIAGLISLIGVAISGIAIVIALFPSDQIKTIEKLKPGAFGTLLYDFKWFALNAAIEVAVFSVLIFVIKCPSPLCPAISFYILAFLLIYIVFYLLFYGYALIGNFIKMSKIKCTLDTVQSKSKSIPTIAIEMQLDFLVSKLYKGDIQLARDFHAELIKLIEESSMNNKAEVVAYLKDRYSSL